MFYLFSTVRDAVIFTMLEKLFGEQRENHRLLQLILFRGGGVQHVYSFYYI